MTFRVRWLGRVRHRDAHALQRSLCQRSGEDHLLLLEHPPVYTLGVRARPEQVLVPPGELGAELVRTDRGGGVTYHGPGQLVGYPILSVPAEPRATPRYVRAVEQLLVDVLGDLGLPGATRIDGYPGVWVEDRKVAAIGVRLSRGRSMHGFALNVDPDMAMFSRILPCGLDKPVTSLAREGIEVAMRDVVDTVARRAVERWAPGGSERQDVAWRGDHRDPSLTVDAGGGAPVRLLGRLAEAGVQPGAGLEPGARKPEWLRAGAHMGPEFRSLKKTMRALELVTVCEEAGCPNIFECWAEGTATFMINGERCTRACGFCLVDTRHPEPLATDEPERVAEAVERMGLAHAVVTAVARDDLPDGGAGAFAATIVAVRRRVPD
ncbi:MAG: lipoyl(octanoyl) transferase LipB, partial [Actinomycetota bacterium]|nr:lipoyl(octanoyl) transferase LipB [Actinomycetota bacterium]